jgi:hypothetical protein
MRLLACGSRDFEDKHGVLYAVIDGMCWKAELEGWLYLVEGEAPGADTLAKRAAETSPTGATIVPFPADWEQYGRRAGPIRNQQMLDEGKPELVIAFINKPLEESRGTYDMVKRAWAADLPVVVVHQWA